MKILVSMLISIVLMVACSTETEVAYNLTVVNQSGEEIQSISCYEENQSSGVTNADNNSIVSGESVFFELKESTFTLTIELVNGESKSDTFTLDFSNGNNYQLILYKDWRFSLEEVEED